ncbi:MAG: pyrimidine/purine nucleoside phosphorylase [Campylobacteraceae bacterium]|nr:pyrimidine/purine nucleoside phosphorylase [Campylobacteraceae bacterium]
MSEFTNVKIVKKANVYFDGKVTSRTIKFEDGTMKTLGFMQVGEFTFNTDHPEIMEIYTGELEVFLPDTKEPLYIKDKGEFKVPAKSKFTVHVKSPVDYCCSFIA